MARNNLKKRGEAKKKWEKEKKRKRKSDDNEDKAVEPNQEKKRIKLVCGNHMLVLIVEGGIALGGHMMVTSISNEFVRIYIRKEMVVICLYPLRGCSISGK
jgi:hypothetical protein